MANAPRDDNRIPVMMGLLSTDGSTPTPVRVDPTTHLMGYNDGTTGSDLTGDNAIRDDNRIVTLVAVSKTDGTTPVPLYVNASGQLLVDSN